MKKILISGYYGFDNFGDDAILLVMTSEIKKFLGNSQITVISNNPIKISRNYNVDSVHRFNFFEIIKCIKECDVFISGGGSLLQDVTSCRSFLYYLGLILLSIFYKKKVIIFSQGIGPISTIMARFLTRVVLLKTDLITVRDKESHVFLKRLGVNSFLAPDPVWSLRIQDENRFLKLDKVNIGLQLRQWKTLSDKNINAIADVITEKFNDEKNRINLIALQDSQDLPVMQKIKNRLIKKDIKADIRIYSNLSVVDNINLLGNLDYLIGMRFHACLVSANYNVPTLALVYDPKVKNLALESNMPFLNINSIHKNKDVFMARIDELISDNEKIRNDLADFSEKKYQLCRDNVILLISTIMKEKIC